MSRILISLMFFLLTSCASISPALLAPGNILPITVIHQKQYIVGGHRYVGSTLVFGIEHLKKTQPDLALDVFMSSGLLKGRRDSCASFIGFDVLDTVPQEKRRYFEGSPGDYSKPFECNFVVLS